jgi:hypothetical protein
MSLAMHACNRTVRSNHVLALSSLKNGATLAGADGKHRIAAAGIVNLLSPAPGTCRLRYCISAWYPRKTSHGGGADFRRSITTADPG